MQPTNPIARLPALWRGKVIARALFLIVAAALLAAVAQPSASLSITVTCTRRF